MPALKLSRLWFNDFLSALLDVHGIVNDMSKLELGVEGYYAMLSMASSEGPCISVEGDMTECEIGCPLFDCQWHVIFGGGYVNRIPGPQTLLFETSLTNTDVINRLKEEPLPDGLRAVMRRHGIDILPKVSEDIRITGVRPFGSKKSYRKCESIQLIEGCITLAAAISGGAPGFAKFFFGDRWERLTEAHWPHQLYAAPTLSWLAQHTVSSVQAPEQLPESAARAKLVRWIPPQLTDRLGTIGKDLVDSPFVSKEWMEAHPSQQHYGYTYSNLSKWMSRQWETSADYAAKLLRDAVRLNLPQKPETYRQAAWEKKEDLFGSFDLFELRNVDIAGSHWRRVFVAFEASKAVEEVTQTILKSDPNAIGRSNVGFCWSSEQSLIPALASMPRWTADKMTASVLLWRAVARAAAEILRTGNFRPLPVATAGMHNWGTTLTLLPAVELPDVAQMFDELCALAAPFEDKLFLTSMADAAPKRLAARVYAALAVAVTAISSGRHENTLRKNERTFFNLFMLSQPITLVESWQESLLNEYGFSFCAHFIYSLYFERSPAFRVERTEEGGLLLKTGFMRAYKQGTAQRFVAWQSGNSKEKIALQTLCKSLGQLPDAVCGFFKPENISGQCTVRVSPALLSDFIFEAIPRLQRIGFFFDTEESFFKLRKPRVVATVTEGAGLRTKGLLDKEALSAFKWEAAVGDRVISRDELNRILKRTGEVFSYGDTFLYLSKEDADAIEAQLNAKHRLNVWDKLRAVLAGYLKGVEVMASDELKDRLRELFRIEDAPQPKGLSAELRPYQKRGYSWLVKNLSLGLGALIADDMGLGKTVQVIAALQHLKEKGELADERVLVVAPASILTNWQREIQRFAPSLTTEIYHGASREMAEAVADADVVITSYGILRRDLTALSLRRWRVMVLDEAQSVKNWASSQAEAARLLPVRQVIAMTGTPVENSLLEYWSILSTVQPGLLGGKTEFQRDYGRPIEESMDRRALARFKQLTAPFILRRVKTDKNVIADLPEKNEIDWFTSLTPQQVKLYEECLKTGLTDIKELADEADSKNDATMKEVVRNLKMKRRGSILRMITHLKQIADSPSIFAKQPAEDPDSGKGEALLSLLGPCLEAGNKVLVFTQYAEMGERLQTWIEKTGIRRPDFLHGGTSIEDRTAMIDRFQTDPSAKVLILTLKAGGTGLNLTAASVVIHYDLWWNPAAENQATDRAYRIGQTKEVIVYRFITAGTFEERIDKLLANKKRLASLAVSSGEKWIGDMSDSELEALFRLGA